MTCASLHASLQLMRSALTSAQQDATARIPEPDLHDSVLPSAYSGPMSKGRLEAFSDGVIAILITIMVLELRVPHGAGWPALRPVVPAFLTYVLSFIFLGIYWNNHHHMFHAVDRINGRILWANLHLLFWLSLVPAVTAW